jgi:outer membrane protein TolC
MKILKLTQTVVLVMSLVFAQISFAKDKPIPPTVPVPPSEIPTAITINPVTLRHQLLETNLSVMQAYNSVKDAKITVNKARAALLPSLNVSAILTGGFASAISFLLPFLAPTNWSNLKAQKNNFEAQKFGYLVLELNTYSSALALYLSVNNDNQVQKTYASEAKDLNYFINLYALPVRIGVMQDSDLDITRAQANSDFGYASQLAQALIGETESMRQMLGLDAQTKITFENDDIAASPYENMSTQQVIVQALDVAPERKQIQYLIDAAGNNKWGAVFSFINSGTYANSGSNSSYNLGVGINIGFGIFPTISQAVQNIKEAELLLTGLAQSNTQVVATAMGSLVEAKNQFDDFSKAEQNYMNIYNNYVKQYRMGVMPLAYVMYARAQIGAATVARLRAELNLNMQRLVIERSLLLNQFALIKGCNPNNAPHPKGKISLDDLCRQTTP